MHKNTVFLARFLGAFTIIETLLMLVYREHAQQRIYDVLYDRALGFTYGLITLAIGLAMITAHNIWKGGLLPIVVTLVGWLLLARGIVLQVLTPETAQQLLKSIGFEPLYYVYLIGPLVVGGYLFIAGWSTKSPE